MAPITPMATATAAPSSSTNGRAPVSDTVGDSDDRDGGSHAGDGDGTGGCDATSACGNVRLGSGTGGAADDQQDGSAGDGAAAEPVQATAGFGAANERPSAPATRKTSAPTTAPITAADTARGMARTTARVLARLRPLIPLSKCFLTVAGTSGGTRSGHDGTAWHGAKGAVGAATSAPDTSSVSPLWVPTNVNVRKRTAS